MSEPRYATFKRTEGGDLVFPLVLVYGIEAVRHRLKVRFEFARREWFLDRRLGLPYFEYIFVKNPSQRVLRTVFGNVILSTPGVETLETFNAEVNRETRKVAITFEAKLTGGEIYRSQPNEFVVTFP